MIYHVMSFRFRSDGLEEEVVQRLDETNRKIASRKPTAPPALLGVGNLHLAEGKWSFYSTKSGKKKKTLSAGAVAKVLSKPEDKWYHISIGTEEGWIYDEQPGLVYEPFESSASSLIDWRGEEAEKAVEYDDEGDPLLLQRAKDAPSFRSMAAEAINGEPFAAPLLVPPPPDPSAERKPIIGYLYVIPQKEPEFDLYENREAEDPNLKAKAEWDKQDNERKRKNQKARKAGKPELPDLEPPPELPFVRRPFRQGEVLFVVETTDVSGKPVASPDKPVKKKSGGKNASNSSKKDAASTKSPAPQQGGEKPGKSK